MKNQCTPSVLAKSRTSPPPGAGERGFSLIEILIAVLILALGLLGLGAVFPVVIREQRIAQDRIGGATAEGNIRAFIEGNRDLGLGKDPISYVPTNPDASDGGQFGNVKIVANYSGWQYLAEPWIYNKWVSDWRMQVESNTNAPVPASAPAFEFSPEGFWETNYDWSGNSAQLNAYRNDGDIMLSPQTGVLFTGNAARDAMPRYNPVLVSTMFPRIPIKYPPPQQVSFEVRVDKATIPLGARLNPAAAPDANNPGTVWDMVARRVTPAGVLRLKFVEAQTNGNSFESDVERFEPYASTLQVAVFVRRVDPGVRLRGNTVKSLRQAFLDTNLSGNDRRLPVGETTGSGNTPGTPTLDGTNGRGGVRYSLVRSIDADFNINGSNTNATRRDQIEIPASVQAGEWLFIRQVGQKVVDNLGNIYTVVGSETTGGVRTIKVDPPVPTSIVASNQANNNINNLNYTTNAIRQLIYTPQVPVAVYVMEVKP